MTGYARGLPGGEALDETVVRLRRATGPRRTVLGWATVDLDRAEREVAAPPDPLGVSRVAAVPDDHALGARCRLLHRGTDAEVLLLEPFTEGRLAAALARHGEGYLALYLLVDGGAPERARQAGFELTTERGGPFGPECLVVTGRREGPFVILAGLD